MTTGKIKTHLAGLRETNRALCGSHSTNLVPWQDVTCGHCLRAITTRSAALTGHPTSFVRNYFADRAHAANAPARDDDPVHYSDSVGATHMTEENRP